MSKFKKILSVLGVGLISLTALAATNRYLDGQFIRNGANTLTIPAVTGTLDTLDAAVTLTNKTMSGASNTFTNIPNSATTATAVNTNSAIMARDGSGQVAATTFTGALAGTATNSTNTAITDDTTTNATMYPTWVTANTGNLPQKVSSTKMSFNPSTGTLTAGQIIDSGLTASTVPYADSNKQLTSSSVTPTELGYVSGVTSSIQTQINNISSGAIPTASTVLYNAGLATSVAANAFTIALKQADGSTNPAAGAGSVQIGFRNATATTGAYSVVSVTGALSIVIPSTATLGSTNNNKNWIYVYAINNAGTIELAVSAMKFPDSGSVLNTTILNTSSTSKTVLYSTTARTGVAVRMIGRIANTQTTAGTWAANASEVSLVPFENNGARSQITYDTGNNYGSTNTRVRRFTNQRVNFGTDLTYADSATNGASVTVNTDGLYSIFYSDVSTAADMTVGIVVNGTAGATSINGITYAQGYRGACSAATTGVPQTHTLSLNMFAGDVIWFQTNTGNNSNTNQTMFSVTKIGE